jgi:hypothetical protein
LDHQCLSTWRARLIWREQLISELEALTDAEALAAWAERVLPQKNWLIMSDAELVETAFAAKLNELDGATAANLTRSGTNAGVGAAGKPATVAGDGSGSETVAATRLQNSTAV